MRTKQSKTAPNKSANKIYHYCAACVHASFPEYMGNMDYKGRPLCFTCPELQHQHLRDRKSNCSKWEPNNTIKPYYRHIAIGNPIALCGALLTDAETNQLLEAWELSYNGNPHSIQRSDERSKFEAYRAEINKRRKP